MHRLTQLQTTERFSKVKRGKAEQKSLRQGEKEELGRDFPFIVNFVMGSFGITKIFASM